MTNTNKDAKPERLPDGCTGIDWCDLHATNHGHPEPPADPPAEGAREIPWEYQPSREHDLDALTAEFRARFDAKDLPVATCPFCGSAAQPYGDAIPFQPTWKMSRVYCPGCGTTTANYGTRDEAIAAWNRRTPTPPNGRDTDEDDYADYMEWRDAHLPEWRNTTASEEWMYRAWKASALRYARGGK